MFSKSSIILFSLAIVFFGIYCWLATPLNMSFGLEPRFDWPDETANYFWIKQYATTGELTLAEPLNLVAKNQIHPRSFNVRADGSLVPGSFLGLILFFGTLAKILGHWLIIYLTPIFSLLGILAFYGIVKRFFDEKIALLTAIMMMFQPAWWYYSATSLLPNVAFTSLILLSVYWLIKQEKIKPNQIILAGFSLGLALSIRPAELGWVMIVYLFVFWHLQTKRRVKFVGLVLFLACAILAIMPSLYQQQIIFGNFLTSGYSQLQNEGAATCATCQAVKSFIAPFGIHPTLMVYNFWTHYFSRLWWFSFLALLGLIAFLTKKGEQKTEIFAYIVLSALVFGWLLVYYGSWQFTDLLTVNLNTLGISYVRYWLPLYLLSLPFVSLALVWLASLFKLRWQKLALGLFLILMFYQSAGLVLKIKADSLLPVRQRIAGYQALAFEVSKITEPDAVIVTVRKDKVFFPERKVIHTFEALSLNQELLAQLPSLVKVAPVYYYTLGPEPRLEFENGLKLQLIKNFNQEVLYRVTLN